MKNSNFFLGSALLFISLTSGCTTPSDPHETLNPSKPTTRPEIPQIYPTSTDPRKTGIINLIKQFTPSSPPKNQSPSKQGGATAPTQGPPIKTQLGKFEGQPRWGIDSSFTEQIGSLSIFFHGSTKDPTSIHISGDPKTDLQSYTLSSDEQTTSRLVDFKKNIEVEGHFRTCTYGRPINNIRESKIDNQKTEKIRIEFWAPGQREDLTPKMYDSSSLRGMNRADMEMDHCPKDAMLALDAAFGENGWSAIKEAILARNRVTRENIETGLWYSKDYSDFKSNFTANSPEMDKQLAQRLDSNIKTLESYGDKLPPNIFYKSLNTQLNSDMIELARSGLAQANKIRYGDAGRTDFEKWDARIGSTVMQIGLRMHNFRLAGFVSGPAFMNVWNEYIQIYRAQIADKGALDPTYRKNMLASLKKYKTASDAEPNSSPDYTQEKTIIFMRPRQSPLYETLYKGINLTQQLAQTRSEILKYIAKLDTSIKESREAFWMCYYARCPTGGVAYHKYSTLLMERDRFYMLREAWEGGINMRSEGKHGNTFNTILGMNQAIDGGYTKGCENAYENFLIPFGKTFGKTPDEMRLLTDSALNSADYLELQQCRDLMEFIWRPRAAGHPSRD